MRKVTKITLGSLAGLTAVVIAVSATGGNDGGPVVSATIPSSTSAPVVPAKSAGTASQQQALESAKSYLDIGTGFSRKGLIKQLTSNVEGFSKGDAIWAVNHSGANWNAQAVLSAKAYMSDGQGFSRAGLIDQLTSPYGEEFTLAQATYAANQVGL